MRRTIAFITLFIASTLTLTAQDLLVKRNGERLKVTTLEITTQCVKYVRYNTKLPVYTLPIAEIEYIEYSDGNRDTFNKSTATETKQSVSGNYEIYDIGSYYNKNGVEGIVIATTDGGAHGTIISIDEAECAWSTIERKKLTHCGCTDKIDGRKNMEALGNSIAQQGLSWDSFPAAKWCKDKGEGWYLPAINEVWMLGTVVNGGSRSKPRREVRKQYNALLKECGGKALSALMYYYSSTEAEEKRNATYSHCSPDTPHTGEGSKNDRLFVRAFYRF